MLGIDFVIRALNGAFQQAPDVLFGIGMHVATYPFFGAMADRFMGCVLVTNALIRLSDRSPGWP